MKLVLSANKGSLMDFNLQLITWLLFFRVTWNIIVGNVLALSISFITFIPIDLYVLKHPFYFGAVSCGVHFELY